MKLKYDPFNGTITNKGKPLTIYYCRKNPFFRLWDKKQQRMVSVMAARLAWTLHHGKEPHYSKLVAIKNRDAQRLLSIYNLELVDRATYMKAAQLAGIERRKHEENAAERLAAFLAEDEAA